MSEILKKYNNQASLYEKMMHWFNYVQSMQSFIRSQNFGLPKNIKILDVGCGTGLTTLVMKEMFLHAEIWGFDFSESMLKECRKKVSEAKLVIGDYHNLKSLKSFQDYKSITLPTKYFDLIISTGSLSEYSNLSTSLPWVKSLLIKEGILFNIGMKKVWYNHLSAPSWGVKLRGEKRFVKECQKQNLSQIKKIKIPLKFFPTSIVKFAVQCQK